MIILAVDPGTRRAGYSVVRSENGRIAVLEVETLVLSAQAPLAHRIHVFKKFFDAKMSEYLVEALALETPFLGKNAQNFLKLGYLRGILLMLSDIHAVPLYEYAPREIKLSVTGYGGADKEQVARVLSTMFPGLIAPRFLDATDALALALCCVWHLSF